MIDTIRRIAIFRQSTRWKTFLLVVLFFLWDGVLPAVVGLPRYIGTYLACAIVIPPVFKGILDLALKKRVERWSWFSIVFFLYCVFIGFVSNALIFRYATSEWLAAQYILIPILLPLFFFVLRFSTGDILAGLWITGTLASFVILADQIVHFSWLNEFTRRSIYEDEARRVVFLKNEIVLAFSISISWLLTKKIKPAGLFFLILTMLVSLYDQLTVMESRLAILAAAVSGFLFLIFFKINAKKKVKFFAAAALAILAILPFAAAKYIDALSAADYAETHNVNIRFEELEYFWSHFETTGGVGFGVMSLGESSNNIQAAATRLYEGYGGIGVSDLGIVGALVQFGYVGLVIVLIMSYKCVKVFWKAGKLGLHLQSAEIFSVSTFMIGFILSPLPMNFFTLNWTIFLGGTLWYLAGRVSLDIHTGIKRDRQMVKRTASE